MQTNRVLGTVTLAATKIRSWSALVMPMALTGLQALSVETPTTTSTG